LSIVDSELEILASGTEAERESAAERLMAGDGPAVAGLVRILASGDSDARWWAARTLAGIPGAEATQALVATLQDPDEDVRVCAVMGLGERRESDAAIMGALLAELRRSGAYVGRHVADALSKIGEPAVSGLIAALEEPVPAIRALAARALVRIESRQSIPALIKALDDPEAAVEHYAWEALQRMGVGVTVFFRP
jgi:HEAT repeat protein